MGLDSLVIMKPCGRKEHLSLESASPKVQESQADGQAHDSDKQIR